MARDTSLTGVERTFGADELIVSKTDTKGRLTYTNQTFLALSGYDEEEVLGQPHSLIRHPDMPRCIFKLLWDTIAKGGEIFAYVVNRSKNGDHYWVLAHVTANIDTNGQIFGYHSNRRVTSPQSLEVIKQLYAKLKAEEERHTDRKAGLEASVAMLNGILSDAGMAYDEFIFTVINK